MKKRLVAVLGSVGVVVAGWLVFQTQSAVAADAEWLTDVEQAQKIAAKENKDLLINFTGSDWCGWCIQLKKEVFSQKEFTKAQEKFVLVEMDFPSDESILPAKVREQNQAWNQRLGVEGFPTIVLTDAQGRPYASTGYVEGGPAVFLTELAKLQQVRTQRDELLAKAEQAKGLDKAKLLDQALAAIPANFQVATYRAEIQNIIALDGKNQAGLKERYQRALHEADAQKSLQKLQEQVEVAYNKDGQDGALKLLKDALNSPEAKANPVLKSRLAQSEIYLLTNFNKTKEALARVEQLIADKSFPEEDRRALRETQARLYQETGKTDEALKVYDALLADAKITPQEQLGYLTAKADVLTAAERPKDALALYNAALAKTEKDTNEWLVVQVNRGDLFTQLKQPKDAAATYDTMLTMKSLVPVQQAMLLVRAAEAHQAAQQPKEMQDRAAKATAALKKLAGNEEVPPQLLEQLETRLSALREEKKTEKSEDKKAE